MLSDLWNTICTTLENGTPVALATIATSDGSTPRSAGAKMAVGPAGLMAGTLGGGAAEAEALVVAARTLEDGQPRTFSVDMSGNAATGGDLICGGVVSIFVERLEPPTLPVFDQLRRRLREGRDAFLLSPLDGAPPRLVVPETPTQDTAALLNDAGESARIVTHKGRECLWEPFRARVRLILAGGGHVSLATARIAALTDFDVTVVDDRLEFANPDRFPWLPAERVRVCPEFRGCLTEEFLGFPVGQKSFVAILTRGHSYDREVLAQALATPAGYIGMIGSRRKRDALYAHLRESGTTDDQLQRVHSPIGLAIGGETPAEIAVSIVAELISVRQNVMV